MSTTGEAVGRDLEIPLPPRRRLFTRIEELPDDQTPADPRGRRVLLGKPSAYHLQLARRYDEAQANGDTDVSVARLYDLGAALMPDLERADVERVSSETIFTIMGLLQEPLAVLESLAKNGGAPSVKAPKGSNSRTPSPTRSRKSRKDTASGSAT